MNKIYVLIAVDAEGALSSRSLADNVYMVDTNKYIGSWQQGQSDLHTVVQDGQVVVWYAVAVNPGNAVSIGGFFGQMVSEKTCVPQKTITLGDGAWGGQVETRGSVGDFPYIVSMNIGSETMTFSAHLKVV